MKHVIAFAILFISLNTSTVISQNDKCNTIISKVSDELSNGGVSIKFTSSTTSDKRIIQKMSGEIKMKGEKFIIHSNIIDIGYDGKTAWSYIKSSNEINISEPTKEELITINPYILLRNYKNIYKTEYKGKKDGYEQIKFTPVSTSTDIKNATISIDTGLFCPTRIEILNRDNSKTVININKYASGEKIDNTIFEFSPQKYPNAEIIDLR